MKTRIKELYELLAGDFSDLRLQFLNLARTDAQTVKSIVDAAEDGGKRIRAMLLFLICRCYGISGQKKILAATAIELLHCATLMHDDVIDGSELRRGLPTINQRFGNKLAILGGDFLLAGAFKLVSEIGNTQISLVLSKAALGIVEGEVVQLEWSKEDKDLRRAPQEYDSWLKKYLDTIDAKTAILFGAAARVGASLAGLDEPKKEIWEKFGLALGRIFQIADDNLDYFSVETESGKQPGNDYFEGKLTLPILILAQKSPRQAGELWQDRTPKNLSIVIKTMLELGVSDCVRKYLDGYLVDAEEILKSLDIGNSEAEVLKTLLEFSGKRSS